MATITSGYADRLDLIAFRVYGRLDDTVLGALIRANPDLPYAFPAGVTVNVPDDPADIGYGAGYEPIDKSGLPPDQFRVFGDFDPDDFSGADFHVVV